jgi:hypothetical protein
MKSGRWLSFSLALLVVWIVFFCGCDASVFGGSSGGAGGSTGKDEGGNFSQGVCGDPSPISYWPKSGYYLEFKASHEIFHVWVHGTLGAPAWASDPSAETIGFPMGPIEAFGLYNAGFDYRFVPEQVEFALSEDPLLEYCDAAPCYVQDALSKWMESPVTWCPWSAVVQVVWNCEGGDGASCAQIFPAVDKQLD